MPITLPIIDLWLSISELELAQAFGYDEDGPTQAYNDDVDFTQEIEHEHDSTKTLNDDEKYRLDTDGLNFVDGPTSLDVMKNYIWGLKRGSSVDDKVLADSFGYFDKESDSNQEETDLVAAAHSNQGDEDSFDVAELSAWLWVLRWSWWHVRNW